jgi:hypothetical protein
MALRKEDELRAAIALRQRDRAARPVQAGIVQGGSCNCYTREFLISNRKMEVNAMVPEKSSNQQQTASPQKIKPLEDLPKKPEAEALSQEEAQRVVGGLNPQPEPPKRQ